jgi:hypothetical protein
MGLDAVRSAAPALGADALGREQQPDQGLEVDGRRVLEIEQFAQRGALEQRLGDDRVLVARGGEVEAVEQLDILDVERADREEIGGDLEDRLVEGVSVVEGVGVDRAERMVLERTASQRWGSSSVGLSRASSSL